MKSHTSNIISVIPGSSIDRLLSIIFKGALVLMVFSVAACDDLMQVQGLPDNTSNPDALKSESSAYALSNSARFAFRNAFASYIRWSGLFTDELQSDERASLTGFVRGDVLADARVDYIDRGTTPPGSELYADLHAARGASLQALGALRKYAPDTSHGQQAFMYIIRAYAQVMLADMFCSGVPLSTLEFERDFTYAAGSTTSEIYEQSILLFDSAVALLGNDTPVSSLAHVGKGRALLALSRFQEAADAVNNIEPGFIYAENVKGCPEGKCVFSGGVGESRLGFSVVTVSNREGGLSIIFPQNSRTAADSVRVDRYGLPVFVPVKYISSNASLVLASGLEAELIKAEAALYAEDIGNWLNILNTLRQNDPRTSSLPLIQDPGPEARLDTLFAERAQWLFLTGHRQGDLRRRLRQQPDLQPNDIYPSGPYPGMLGSYGTAVTFPISEDLEGPNPLFKGCFGRGA